MAETKTRASSGRGKAIKSKTPPARKPKPRRRKTASHKPSSKNGVAPAESARKAVESTTKKVGHSVSEAGHGVGRAARRARTPLLAGGAALAGVAGGIALGTRTGHSKKMPRIKVGPQIKVDSGDLAKAAKEVGEFGVQVGQLASELRHNREQVHGAKRRSPIEVVLQGLTSQGRND